MVYCYSIAQMSVPKKPRGEEKIAPSKSSVVFMLTTIGDTTWRMFGPTLGFTILGLIGDRTFQTKPFLTLAGVLVGALGAGILIKRQLKNEEN